MGGENVEEKEDPRLELLYELRAKLISYDVAMNKKIEALKAAMLQYLELTSSMGLSTIKANLKNI